MSKEFLDYVEDILDAMDKAEILVQDVTFDHFEADFRIADDHPIVSQEMQVVLAAQDDMGLMTEATNGDEAVRLAQEA